jgi:hypothetical protein
MQVQAASSGFLEKDFAGEGKLIDDRIGRIGRIGRTGR